MLSQGGGGPLPPTPPAAGKSGGGRRKALVAGGVVGILALGGGAFAAYSWFSGTGPQPAEALPANTLGYLSLDLDPSGSQKIEAYNTLKKFPAIEQIFDEEGVEEGTDLRRKLLEEALAEDEECSLDYDEDIEPWLGERFAVAAISQGEDEDPAPVFVVQVSDGGAAEETFEKLNECSGDSGGAGWAIDDEWALVAETSEIAESAAEGAAEESLADDADFQKWTSAAGDAGIVQGYASPDVGKELADELAGLASMGSSMAEIPSAAEVSPAPTGDISECFELDPVAQSEEFQACIEAAEGAGATPEPTVPGLPEPDADAIAAIFEDFQGGAMNIRFADGSLEVEVAADGNLGKQYGLSPSEEGGAAVAALPADTMVAFGAGFEDGWGQSLIDYYSAFLGEEFDLEGQIEALESQTGLAIPEDVEALLGDSIAVGVSADIDFEGMSGPADAPVGARITGDPEETQRVLDKLLEQDPTGMVGEFLGTDSEGDVLAISPNEGYREELLGDGGLGDNEVYQDVVREDAASVFFVNFDAGDGVLDNLLESAGAPGEVRENAEPLSGLGFTGWLDDDDVAHSVFRMTTD
ncbi:DUF3352 domain-containing protein [Nocardioides nanhaiensis]|uniref:DUF3352 domain-containing protein n=1 Tax=Nocardioides nanhaiensis TaxID=1476871 RepID=A0ABP8WUJ5_9ACTN